jgi:cytochrome c-type biogenesis protein CcmH/NrfG
LGDKKKYKLGFRPIKQDLLSYNGERNTMSEETAEIDEEILEEYEEEEEEEGSRDWGKVGIAMLFFLLIVIGYYVIQALS